jgi:hypothetical protein
MKEFYPSVPPSGKSSEDKKEYPEKMQQNNEISCSLSPHFQTLQQKLKKQSVFNDDSSGAIVLFWLTVYTAGSGMKKN